MAVIDTNNLVSDFIANTEAIFEDNMRTLGLKEIFDEDVILVPTVPSLALSCISFWNTLRTISSSNVRYQFDFIGDFWYYDSIVDSDMKRNEIMSKAYRITRHIIENASLNGFLTNTRAEVKSCIYTPRLRSGVLMASARIVVVAPYQFRVSSIV